MESKAYVKSPVNLLPLSWSLLCSTERLNQLARTNGRRVLDKKDKNKEFLTLFWDGYALIHQQSFKSACNKGMVSHEH